MEYTMDKALEKVSLLGIEKNISAWEVVLKITPENNEIWNQLGILDKLRKSLLHDFPNVNLFIRPEFDDEILSLANNNKKAC
jgi:hypothetical protein